MATMSLTPRETSSGLRRPAEPAPSRRNPTKQGSVALPKARGAIPMMNGGRRGGHHRDDREPGILLGGLHGADVEALCEDLLEQRLQLR